MVRRLRIAVSVFFALVAVALACLGRELLHIASNLYAIGNGWRACLCHGPIPNDGKPVIFLSRRGELALGIHQTDRIGVLFSNGYLVPKWL